MLFKSFQVSCKSQYLGIIIAAMACLSAQAIAEAGDEGFKPLQAPTQQDEQNPFNEAAEDTTITYSAEFFAQYDPISARDMLDRIPGIDSIIGGGGGNKRGLGAGDDNVLINSKRIAGKENDSRSVLGQIAASQVAHIDIIRDVPPDLDVGGAGPVVNVVLREDAGSATVTAEINADYYQQSGKVQPGAVLSINGRGQRLNYLATLEAEPRYEQEERNETSVLGDESPKDQTFENRVREQTNYKLNTTMGWQVTDADLLQINALYEKSDPPRTTERSILVLDPNDDRLLVPGTTQLISQFDDVEAERDKWEFGTNYIHDFGGGTQYKLIVLANQENDDSLLNRISDEDGDFETILFIDEKRQYGEKILRNSLNFPIAANQDVELGVEGALTTLDSRFLLSLDADASNNTPSASEIEEMRYEPFAVHNWQVTPSVAIETSLVAEISEITFDDHGVDSDGDPISPVSRDFKFWKPKVDIRYDITSALQFRTTINRDISQLNFRDFTARQDGDLDSNADSGNPDLVQEKAWEYEFNLEYRLPNDGGVINSRLYYHDIEDVIERVDASYTTTDPVTDEEELVITSAPGNIGDGERYGLEVDSSIRLGFWGLPEALLTMGVNVKDSSVNDPFTNEDRRLGGHGRGGYNIGFRHDVPKWNLNYGFNYNEGFDGATRRVDIDDIRDFEREPGARIYVEKVAFNGIRFRFDVMNALDGVRCLKRTRFDGFTADGVVEEVENSCIGPGRKMALKIRTTF